MRNTRRTSRLTTALAVAAAALAAASPAAAAPLPVSGTLDLAEEADGRVVGAAFGDLAGTAVRPAGDVNGDGRADVLIGAPSADPAGRSDAGAAYVLFGGSLDGLPATFDKLGSRGLQIQGAAAGDHAGVSVAPAGDVDGDGLADVLVGAPRANARGAAGSGAAYLVLGGREAGTVDLGAPGPRVRALTTGVAGDLAGSALDSVPDADGDGKPEVLVAAPRDDTTRTKEAGTAYLVFARALGADVDLENLGDAGVRIDGTAGDRAGFAVAGTPDLNGDKRGDLLIGAPSAANPAGRPSGAAYVVFGRGEPGRIELAQLGAGGYAVTGSAEQDQLLGAAVAPVGDPNGDGVVDLAFGAPGADRNARKDSGSVHVIPAKAGPEPVAAGAEDRPGLRIDGAATGDALGSATSAAADLNEDGRTELVVAAPESDALSRPDAGSAYVVFGGEGTEDVDLSGLVDRGFRIAGADPSGHLRAVAGVGDVDGDGVGDMAAGAYAGGGTGAGAVYLVLGPKPLPPPPPPDPGVAEEVAAGCMAIGNVEIIVDDSKSMREADPEELRRQAVELLLTKPRNEGKVIGAYEFGSRGRQLFPPQVILPRGAGNTNQRVLLGALDQGIGGNNGGTNYNAAFRGAADDNPAAQARIFITDGGHRAGRYRDLHQGGAPTYVIGIGISKKGRAGRRLERIASDTQGAAFVGVDDEELPKVLNTIDSKLNCDVDIDSDEDVLSEEDPTDQQVIELLPDARTCDIDVNWGDDADDIEPEEIAFLDDDGDPVARAGRKALRRAVKNPGKTFSVNGIRLKGRRRGGFFGLRIAGRNPAERLRVRYRARKVSGKAAGVTSQVAQSRRRQVEQARRRG